MKPRRIWSGLDAVPHCTPPPSCLTIRSVCFCFCFCLITFLQGCPCFIKLKQKIGWFIQYLWIFLCHILILWSNQCVNDFLLLVPLVIRALSLIVMLDTKGIIYLSQFGGNGALATYGQRSGILLTMPDSYMGSGESS